MNKAIKDQWVAALRSGDYKQGKGQLRRGDAFCCLGVLCNLHAQAHPEIAATQKTTAQYLGARGVPCDVVLDWAGLGCLHDEEVSIYGRHTWLLSHNDSGRTFNEIADAIEAQL